MTTHDYLVLAVASFWMITNIAGATLTIVGLRNRRSSLGESAQAPFVDTRLYFAKAFSFGLNDWLQRQKARPAQYRYVTWAVEAGAVAAAFGVLFQLVRLLIR
ncbi:MULTISPECIES: hypothetical protein [unclassified Bradyrhizobium]|uniref:hypothetical protein n=1 Tax=unclassified Bradyrhizobium TaxID=2631580 RepID=UPI0020B44884|nr:MULTISPECIES: hypothetical protein [unclassified Bradyrhizobium]MCP3379270.1 hypothetical protein [Bradyrhizobium sp. CCGUVB4N]MCP3440020.1 hypothetical protein [Bradyrhizobium sp. CCGUVB14]